MLEELWEALYRLDCPLHSVMFCKGNHGNFVFVQELFKTTLIVQIYILRVHRYSTNCIRETRKHVQQRGSHSLCTPPLPLIPINTPL